MSVKQTERLVSGAVAREPWLEHVRARAQRPASARHVARPKVAAAAARPASAHRAARSVSLRAPSQTVGGGVGARPARRATGARLPSPPAKTAAHACHNGDTTAYSVRECDVVKTTFSVREKRLRCSVVAGRQPFTPRPATRHPASARVAHSATPASPAVVNQPDDARQSAQSTDAALSALSRGSAAAPEEKDHVQNLREMLGVTDGMWAFAPDANASFGGADAIGPAGRRRLLMPTWERLARRVDLMQRQNEEVSELLTGLASTAAAPVTQRPTRTSSVLPKKQQDKCFTSTTQKNVATGWRGLPESSRRLGSNVAENRVADQPLYGRAGQLIMPENKVKIKLEPGRDWSELLW